MDYYDEGEIAKMFTELEGQIVNLEAYADKTFATKDDIENIESEISDVRSDIESLEMRIKDNFERLIDSLNFKPNERPVLRWKRKV